MEEIFIKILQFGLTPNMFYVLHCMHNNIVPNKSINTWGNVMLFSV